MKRNLISLFLLLAVAIPSLADAVYKPTINARAAVLIESKTGKVLYQKNSLALMEPASTTKIMTAVLGIEKGKLTETVYVSAKAASREGTSMHLQKNDKLTLRDLLYGLLLVSGNDAATAIAEHIGGTEENFAALMTAKARTLGMKYTQFKNASGLPAYGHYTTAYDMALLARYAMQNPVFARIVGTKKTIIANDESPETFKLVNHNKLLWLYPYTTGIKTGYTIRAGGCLVASATRRDTTLIAVVMKSGSIYKDSQKLFNFGFNLKG
ncbi:MAG: D-alanyl-D-alanine carboxypeptidase family protein [Bacillota bacterium]